MSHYKWSCFFKPTSSPTWTAEHVAKRVEHERMRAPSPHRSAQFDRASVACKSSPRDNNAAHSSASNEDVHLAPVANRVDMVDYSRSDSLDLARTRPVICLCMALSGSRLSIDYFAAAHAPDFRPNFYVRFNKDSNQAHDSPVDGMAFNVRVGVAQCRLEQRLEWNGYAILHARKPSMTEPVEA